MGLNVTADQRPPEVLARHAFGKVLLYTISTYGALLLYYYLPTILYSGIYDFFARSRYAWAWAAGGVTAGPAVLASGLLISFNFARRDGVAIEVHGELLCIYLVFPRKIKLNQI